MQLWKLRRLLRALVFPRFLPAAILVLSGCAALPAFHGPDLQIAAEQNEKLSKDPELAWRLDMLKAPQDDNWHFSANVQRLHDRQTGSAIGWAATFGARHALPFILRPRPTPSATPRSD